MNFTAQYSNLETLTPQIDTNPANINPGQLPPDLFRDDLFPGGTTITIDGPKYSAGLSKRYVTPPAGLLQAFTRYTFSYQIRPSETAHLYSQIHENDFRMSGPDGNVYPADCQKNNQEGGVWMIPDGKGGWVNTSFNAGLWTPDVWTPVSQVYLIDWTKETVTFVSITDGTQTKAIAATIPAVALKWAPGLLGFQNQEGLNALGGSYTCSRRNISISMQ